MFKARPINRDTLRVVDYKPPSPGAKKSAKKSAGIKSKPLVDMPGTKTLFKGSKEKARKARARAIATGNISAVTGSPLLHVSPPTTEGKQIVPISKIEYLMDVWAIDDKGRKLHPYKGERGDLKGLFSVNFTSDTKKFQGMTEDALVKAITPGRFRDRGTIRMLPLQVEPGADRSAFAPQFYLGKQVKGF